MIRVTLNNYHKMGKKKMGHFALNSEILFFPF